MKELIKKLLAQGKSNDEIQKAVAEALSKKEVEAVENVKEVIADALKEFKAEQDIKAAFDSIETEKKENSAIKELKAELKELKEKKLPGTLDQAEQKSVKYFDKISGTCKEYKTMPEGYKAVADMFYHSKRNDLASLEAIQKEIQQENKKDFQRLGVKTPLYTDATTGSYLIPTIVDSEIMQLTYELSDMYKRSNRKNVVVNDVVYPVMADMTFAFITDESTQLGDKTPTIANPAIAMKRYGGMAYLSNELINMRSPEVVSTLIASGASANADFIDLYSVAGSVTTESDPFNGLIFDANTAGLTSKALTSITDQDFVNLLEELSYKVKDATFIANRKVRNKYGLLETTGGHKIFKDFLSNGQIAPMGMDFIENRKIPSTLTINSSSAGTNTRAAGSSDALICADLSKLHIGLRGLRIDMSEHLKFDYDQTAWRFHGAIGCKLGTGSSDAGVSAAVVELT